MKLTKSKLQQIIKEELSGVLSEEEDWSEIDQMFNDPSYFDKPEATDEPVAAPVSPLADEGDREAAQKVVQAAGDIGEKEEGSLEGIGESRRRRKVRRTRRK